MVDKPQKRDSSTRVYKDDAKKAGVPKKAETSNIIKRPASPVIKKAKVTGGTEKNKAISAPEKTRTTPTLRPRGERKPDSSLARATRIEKAETSVIKGRPKPGDSSVLRKGITRTELAKIQKDDKTARRTSSKLAAATESNSTGSHRATTTSGRLKATESSGRIRATDREGRIKPGLGVRFSLGVKFAVPVCVLIAIIIVTWGLLVGRRITETLLEDIKKSGASHVMALATLGQTITDAYYQAPDFDDERRVWPVNLGLILKQDFYKLMGLKENDKQIPPIDKINSAAKAAQLLRNFASYEEIKADKFDPTPANRHSNEVLDAYILDSSDNLLAGALTQDKKFKIESLAWLKTGLDTVTIGDQPYNMEKMGINVWAAVIVGGPSNGQKVLAFMREFKGSRVPGKALLMMSAEVIDIETSRVTRMMLVVGITAMILAILVCVVIASLVTKPAKILISDMEIVAGGNLKHRTKAHSQDEIGLIANEFNEMTHKLAIAAAAEKEQQRLENELEMAKEIQKTLLPKQVPLVKGVDIAAVYRPAREMGGDYYDFFPIDKEHVGAIVADVSGKGVPASLVMTKAQTILRFFVTGNTSAADTVTKANSVLARDIKRGMFVTAFYVVFNARTRNVLCASAGHNPMIWFRAGGEIELINPSGIALGFDKGAIFSRTIKEQNLSVTAGDRLVLYTDGVVEAMNNRNEEYTEERLIQFVKDNRELTSQEFIDALLEDLDHHKGKAEQHDDITMVVMTVGETGGQDG